MLLRLIEHVACEVAPHDMKKRRPTWFELSLDELLDAIAMRDIATVIHRKNPVEGDNGTKAKLATARKHIKRVVKEAKVRSILSKREDIENHEDEPRDHWKAVGDLNAGVHSGHINQARNIKMMKPDGNLARNEEESAQVFRDHFEQNVFNRTSNLAMRRLSSTKSTRFNATQDLEIL
jgi:hypothetical protein